MPSGSFLQHGCSIDSTSRFGFVLERRGMPDLDTTAFLAGLFGEAELIAQPPATATGAAATLPHVQARMAADRRAQVSPELAALKAGRIIARVIDLDAAGLKDDELPCIAWGWDFRWTKNGRLIMRDPSGRTRRFVVVAFTRRAGTEAPEAAGDPASFSPEGSCVLPRNYGDNFLVNANILG
jgi:hypothetical protein